MQVQEHRVLATVPERCPRRLVDVGRVEDAVIDAALDQPHLNLVQGSGDLVDLEQVYVAVRSSVPG